MKRAHITIFTLLLLCVWNSSPAESAIQRSAVTKADVVIYGGTPAGIAAALEAGREELQVVLIEPYSRVGGLMTNGLSHADFRTFEGLTGTYLKFTKRVQKYYIDQYGADSPQAECFRGTHAEPHVNQLIFDQMLAELPTVQIWTQTRLLSVETEGDRKASRINAITVQTKTGGTRHLQGTIFIDATYEGDLLITAKMPFRLGEESRGKTGESLAPENQTQNVQGYNFRLIMTQVPENRVAVSQPEGYRREDFLPLLDLFASKKLKSVFCAPSGGIYKYQPPRLPNDKYDINDVSRGLVRLSLPQYSKNWPSNPGSAIRERIFKEHLRHQIGMLYFLQNDEAVPEAIRKEALSWGLCKDEFVDNGHLPEQLYIREGTRLYGLHSFSEQDTDHAPGDARAVLHPDSIAMGDYGPNCHGTAHEGDKLGGKHTGEFYKRVPPYQIPYGVLISTSCENLLVPVACSSTHVGFCALRLEPIWMSLGQAAGIAAVQSFQRQVPVQKVSISDIQSRLHEQGGATIYFSDVLPDHPEFAAVQWWGTLGGFHGLFPMPETPGERGKNILGQYYEAFPGHAAELQKPVDSALLKRWVNLAEQHELSVPAEFSGSRGEFIGKLHEQFRSSR